MKQSKATFPSQEIDSGTSAMWLTLWAAMAEEFGIEAFKAAVFELLRGLGRSETERKFMFGPGDIQSRLEANQRARLAAERASQKKFQACEVCGHTGLRVFERANGDRYARDCECLMAWRADTGRAPAPAQQSAR